MGIEDFGVFTAPKQEVQKIIPEKEIAKKELSDLGINGLPENIQALIEQQKTQQHPVGFKDVLDNANNPEKLKELMVEKGISLIAHAEGVSVWDHVKKAIQEIDLMQISNEEKKDLKLIMLFHDLGKTVSCQTEKNIEQTKKKLEKGELYQAMIGHHQEKLNEIEAGFKANGVDDKKLKMFMLVIKNHMNTSILEQDPRKTVKLFEELGDNEEERREVVRLLTFVLQADGNATQHIKLIDGDLRYSKNEKKTQFDFDGVWKKYEDGKKITQQEEEKKKKQEADTIQELSIFGKKLSEYLIKDRDIKPGPAMGEALGKVKKIITENQDKAPLQIKKIIDDTDL